MAGLVSKVSHFPLFLMLSLGYSQTQVAACTLESKSRNANVGSQEIPGVTDKFGLVVQNVPVKG